MFPSLRLAVFLSLIICSANQLPSNLFKDSSDQHFTSSEYKTITDRANYSLKTLSFMCDRISDSLALVALFNSTNGPGWTETWDLQQPMDTWDGVRLTAEGCVDSIDMFFNHLNGNIPSELGNLSELIYLGLSDNQLSGGIPSELGNLSKLKFLSLYSNQLIGNIPTELGKLSNLTLLVIRENQLSGGIPFELGNLSELIYLDLSANQLSGGIPSSLGNLSKLDHLTLYSNQLNGNIPPEIGNLTFLTLLDLNNNQLFGNIISEIGNLIYLEWLALNNNQLIGNVPSTLGNLSALYYLALNDNQLSGNIPQDLGNLSNINYLFLNNNQLVGCFPPTLTVFCDELYDFTNNPGLTWNGDFTRFCNGENQIGVSCNDGNPETENDAIHGDCHCYGCSPYLISIDTILCPGQSIEVNGTVYSETIITNFVGTTISGCDSIIQLNITILQDTQFNFEIDTTLCFGESIMVNNIEYTETGVYNIVIPESTQSGCDSTILLDLLIATTESATQIVDTFLCSGESLIVGGNQYDKAGQYSITLPGASILGCDSIVELNIQDFSLENANAGSDQYLCLGEVVNLSGNLPIMSTGHWESDNPAVIFDNPNSPITIVNGLSNGSNIISWNVVSLECDESSSSSVEIFIQNSPSSSNDQFTIPFNTVNYVFNPLNNDELITIENWELSILNHSLGGEIFQEDDSIFLFESSNLFFGIFNAQYEICDVLCPDQCDISEIIINVLPPDNLAELIPSGITPNEDGINDVFIIPPIDINPQLYSNSELIIINRWGSVVYKEKPYHNNWGGTNMQGDYLPQSTYYYIWIPGPGEKDITGRVTILK